MIIDTQSYCDKAKLLGLSPYEFESKVVKHDIFNRMNGRIQNVNQLKYMAAARKVLDEITGK